MHRRRFNTHLARLAGVAAAASAWCAPGNTWAAVATVPAMTDGPFYPPRAWRERQGSDWDSDLTRVQRARGLLTAQGEHLALALALVDTRGRPVDNAEVEIWQCDALAIYHHPYQVRAATPPSERDDGFQGFGAARSARDGGLAFRTIRPVAYPGRTPHIHVKLRHPSWGELSSQLFVDGDPGNERDFLWRGVAPARRALVAMKLQPASTEDQAAGLRWRTRHTLVLPD
jgi:protocatechuate 3,4-dioxygenase, beta subunit